MLVLVPSTASARGNNNAAKNRQAALQAEANQLQKDVDALDAQVKTAQSEYDDAKKEMDPLRKEIEGGEAAVRDAGHKLSEVVTAIEDEQPKDSAFAKAKAKFLESKEAYENAVAEVKKSAEYEAAYEAAKASETRAQAIPAVTKQYIDDNTAIQDLKTNHASARATYDTLRDELLKKSDKWKEASDALAAARKSQDEAAQKSKSAALKEKTAKVKLARLQAQLAVERAQLARLPAAKQPTKKAGQ